MKSDRDNPDRYIDTMGSESFQCRCGIFTRGFDFLDQEYICNTCYSDKRKVEESNKSAIDLNRPINAGRHKIRPPGHSELCGCGMKTRWYDNETAQMMCVSCYNQLIRAEDKVKKLIMKCKQTSASSRLCHTCGIQTNMYQISIQAYECRMCTDKRKKQVQKDRKDPGKLYYHIQKLQGDCVDCQRDTQWFDANSQSWLCTNCFKTWYRYKKQKEYKEHIRLVATMNDVIDVPWKNKAVTTRLVDKSINTVLVDKDKEGTKIEFLHAKDIYRLKKRQANWYLAQMWHMYRSKHHKQVAIKPELRDWRAMIQAWQYVMAMIMLMRDRGIWDDANNCPEQTAYCNSPMGGE